MSSLRSGYSTVRFIALVCCDMAGAPILGYSAVQLLHGRCHVVTELFGCYMVGAKWLQRCLVVTWLVPRGYNAVWLLHGWYRVVIALFGCYMAGTT